MIPLMELPIEILQDNLFPFLPARDLLSLTCTSKFFLTLCTDDAVWKRKLLADFNYSGAGTARISGWKVIYRGLHKPKVYVWGETANARMGVVDLPKSSVYGQPFPLQLKFPSTSTRIVSIAAGGMSFYALDSEGSLHVWGTLDGNTPALSSDGYSEAGRPAYTPHKLLMPSPIRSISCGRLHASVLDSRNKVWTFVNWGRPFSINSPTLLDAASPPVQVECGWGFSSVLTASGNIYVWWPFSDPLARIIQENQQSMDSDPDKKAKPTEANEIPCATYSIDSLALTKLPPLPDLPALRKTGVDPEDNQEPPRIVQIAGLDKHLVGVTDQGHVLKFGVLADETQSLNGSWEYLHHFSDISHIRGHKVFNDGNNSLAAPDIMKITHVTGNFQHFVAYSTGSSSLVLIGEDSATAVTEPDIKPELQNRSVISVAIGDWHNAALTADGKVLTWGAFSSGALGLGDPAKLPPGAPGGYPNDGQRRRRPPQVDTPSPVRFDWGTKEPRDRFAFAITAAGWHTGALVMDLNPDGDEDDEYEMEEPDQPLDPHEYPLNPDGQGPPILPPFRIGIHRRGRGRGV
ncbi:hypothetical protein D9611_006435 [Ephemerocybe angulata]|uniref:F-box domain-containing protein n=1 Tax=Ephemerocybe angulata TaxID=980116 RepID=A0A8H5C6K1_9AGAR|nr:hypothetical protein D9611_006435 [Tulosesus angulatus]